MQKGQEQAKRYDKDYQLRYYQENRLKILEKKKIRNAQPEIKQHNSDYHRVWYQDHKDDMAIYRRQLYLKKKNGNSNGNGNVT